VKHVKDVQNVKSVKEPKEPKDTKDLHRSTRILFIVPSLTAGGLERVAALLANTCVVLADADGSVADGSATEFAVTLLTLDASHSFMTSTSVYSLFTRLSRSTGLHWRKRLVCAMLPDSELSIGCDLSLGGTCIVMRARF
jgi:hypothetical protein